ncbi:MAG: hypothetical protein ACJ0QH_03540 [Flavobacteriales bacterium]
MDLFKIANSLFSHKYKLKNHISSNSVTISNGKIKIRIKLTKSLDPIVISSEKKFTGWYLIGWLISFVILNVIGAIIYWLVLKPSDDDVIIFCDEVISELKNNLNSKIAVGLSKNITNENVKKEEPETFASQVNKITLKSSKSNFFKQDWEGKLRERWILDLTKLNVKVEGSIEDEKHKVYEKVMNEYWEFDFIEFSVYKYIKSLIYKFQFSGLNEKEAENFRLVNNWFLENNRGAYEIFNNKETLGIINTILKDNKIILTEVWDSTTNQRSSKIIPSDKLENINQNLKESLPEWFNIKWKKAPGGAHHKGDEVTNIFNGKKYKLTADELSMYNILGTIYYFIENNMNVKEMEGKSEEVKKNLRVSLIKDFENGIDWFSRNNYEAYKGLCGGFTQEIDLPIGYKIIGLDIVYDGSLALGNFRQKQPLNYPFLFLDSEDGLNYITISTENKNNAIKIIDEIRKKTTDFSGYNFNQIDTSNNDNWDYMFNYRNLFYIGYVVSSSQVRINMLHSFISLENTKDVIELTKEHENLNKLAEVENKHFIKLKHTKQINIVDDCGSNYSYFNYQNCDLYSHFFGLVFEDNNGKKIFICCHVYRIFKGGEHEQDYEIFITNKERFPFPEKNGNERNFIYAGFNEIIEEIVSPHGFDCLDESYSIDEFVGESFEIKVSNWDKIKT